MMSFEAGRDMTSEQLMLIALSVHNVIGRMPVAVKARNDAGVIITDGHARGLTCESKALDGVFSGAPVQKTHADCGEFAGIPMYASAIFDAAGRAVAAIGVIDTSGMLSLKEFVEISSLLCHQSGNRVRPKE
ncbi:MAG: hypothetical protein A4E28_00829 [Methanocella sp. PtaU1.Bin125]|nr:MAG: hypothetical protein A4E28_00829 [Methanocella sp. PtaU1.Bin125]